MIYCLNAYIYFCINTTIECDHFFLKSGVIIVSFRCKFVSIPILIYDFVFLFSYFSLNKTTYFNLQFWKKNCNRMDRSRVV